MDMSTARANREIEHGSFLATKDPEVIWGWKSPAGRLRAERRAALIIAGVYKAFGQPFADERLEENALPISLSGKKILEIGCGTGMFTEMFARTGAEIIAVDIAGELLEKARHRGLPPSKVRFFQKRFEDCDVEGPFDAVIGSSILHHLEIGVALEKIFSLLKPGGVFSFAEPNMLNPQIFIERKFTFLRPWFFPFVSPDETAFIGITLRWKLTQVGFDHIDIVPFDWLHPGTPKFLIGAVSRLGFFLERLPLIREFSGSLLIQGRRSAPALEKPDLDSCGRTGTSHVKETSRKAGNK